MGKRPEEFLKRDRRQQQALPPNRVFANPFVSAYPSMQYTPMQYWYTPDLRNFPSPVVTKPLYQFAAHGRQEEAGDAAGEVEVAVTGEDAEDGEIQLPVDPPGAHVANDPLPEKTFPIFPYDPEQDEPAAVAF
jgi:hypothetical protein